ncbi:SNase-domain-containing protein [Lenzites betulinus]|nr:SNase-domain-containing protein [Lenzites betulinus]
MSSWLPWSPSKPSQASKDAANTSNPLDQQVKVIIKNTDDLIASFNAHAASLPPHVLIISTFILGGVATLGVKRFYGRHLRRIRNGEYVTTEMLARKRWRKGYVTSVGDADNFRLYHTPGIGWKWPLKFRSIPTQRADLKNETLHVRIAGVDAPELSHFGNPAQPYAAESLAWLKGKVDGRFVHCQFIRKDQYGRIVSMVRLPPRFLPAWLAKGKDLSLEMLRAGCASVYEQTGAEYGKSGLEEFLRVQKEAQRTKKGMWERGTQGETPGEYKKRHRAVAQSDGVVADSAPTQASGTGTRSASKGGWLRRLFFRTSGR